MDADRIMVLDAGTVVELDSPAALLANEASTFFALARDQGAQLPTADGAP